MLFVRLAIANQHKALMHMDCRVRILRLLVKHSIDDDARCSRGCEDEEEKSANVVESFGRSEVSPRTAKWSIHFSHHSTARTSLDMLN